MLDLKTLSHILKDADREELLFVIHQLATKEDATSWFLDYCSKKATDTDTVTVTMTQIDHIWADVNDMMEEYYDRDGWDYDYEIQSGLEDISRLAADKGHQIPWKYRWDLVVDMLTHESFNSYPDALYDAAASLCFTKEECLQFAHFVLEHVGDYGKQAASILLQNGEEEAFFSYMMAHLEYGDDYIQVADYLCSKGRDAEAVDFLKKGLLSLPGYKNSMGEWLLNHFVALKDDDEVLALYREFKKENWISSGLIQIVYQYFHENYELRKDCLLQLISHSYRTDAYFWYQKCEEELIAEDFSSLKEHLQEALKKSDFNAYLKVLLDEDKKREVLDLLLAESLGKMPMYGSSSSSGQFPIIKRLEDEFPEAVFRISWNHCWTMAAQSNRSLYPAIVTKLENIHHFSEMKGLLALWETEYAEFLICHKRKSTLMGLIRNSGL